MTENREPTRWERHIAALEERKRALKAIEDAERKRRNTATTDEPPPLFTEQQIRSMGDDELQRYFGVSWRMVKRNIRREGEMLVKNAKREVKRRERIAREERAVVMRKEGKTLEQIGQMTGNVTRERVRQILVGYEQRTGEKLPRLPVFGGFKPKIVVMARCAICDKPVEVVEYKLKTKPTGVRCPSHKKVHATNRRFYQACPNWDTMTDTQRAKWKYHNDPETREKHMKSVMAWHRKQSNNPHYKALQKAAAKRWVEKKMRENPHWWKEIAEKRKEKMKKRLEEIRKSNPLLKDMLE